MFRRRLFYYRKIRIKKAVKIYTVLLIIILAFLVFFLAEHRFTPSLIAIAESRAKILTTEAINEAVKEKIVKNVKYKDLITIHKNTAGQITLIQINTVEISRIEAETALEVTKTLKDVTIDSIDIPIGMITGSNILANYGPKIRINLYPVGNVKVNTDESFEEAGINQTRHRIILNIIAEIKIARPLLSSTMEVETNVPVAETIIVGDVPRAILDFKQK